MRHFKTSFDINSTKHIHFMCSPNEHSFIISADFVPIMASTSSHAPQQRGLEMGAPLIPGPAALLRRGKAPVRSTPRIAGSQMAPYSESNICRSSELLSYTIGSYTQRKIVWQAAKTICCFLLLRSAAPVGILCQMC